MPATARLPDASAEPTVIPRRDRALVRAAGQSLGRYHLELLWGAFAVACEIAMFAWPNWQTVPFFLVWISLTLLYGLKVWPLRPTLIVLVAVMVLTGIPTAMHAMGGADVVQRLAKVPLMALLFLAVVWHARRRVEAVRIAERRAAEANSMLERQERFVHDASHELRTPLTIARGHLELLGENPAASGAKAPPLGAADQLNVEIALDELSRIDAIVGRLLLLASAGQPDFLRTEEVDLEPFLEDIFMRWSEVARRAWRLGSLAPGRLPVDPDRLRAALDALLENAIKFTQEGDAIELRAVSGGPCQIAIEVVDEGCGVQADALDRIFDRFGRADAARTRSDGGVGLGLAIVDAIAKRHGGRCMVTSASHGSTFALLLPGFRPVGHGTAAGAGETRSSLAPVEDPQPAAALSPSST
jgi:signal transduction histidine kinase